MLENILFLNNDYKKQLFLFPDGLRGEFYELDEAFPTSPLAQKKTQRRTTKAVENPKNVTFYVINK